MNKEARFVAIILGLIILSAGFSLATFSYKNNNLITSYSAGEKIRGTINISLSSEPVDSIFRSNFNGSIKLIDLIKTNNFVEKTDYNCNYPNCLDSYKVLNEITNSVSLASEPIFAGFKISGENIDISSLKFSLSSNAGESCSRPILIDILDKNEAFIQPNKNSGNLCEEEFRGCFNSNTNLQLAEITTNLYCEKMNLTIAPGYQIGAIIQNGTSSANIKMSMQDSQGNTLGECTLPKQSQQTEKVGCSVNYSVTKNGEYLICIYSDIDAEYKLDSERTSPTCGTSSGGGSYNIDFDMFAKPLQFASVGELNVNSSTFYELNNGLEIVNYVNDYLEEVYQKNCSNGCVIPFKITGISQSMTFSNEEIKYRDGSSPLFSETKLYNLEKDKAKITTPKTININIEPANLVIPIGSKEKTLKLYLDNREILPSPLNINILPSFSFDISPKIVLLGAKTSFFALTSANITLSNWNFGDGSTKTSTGKTTSHRYIGYNKDGYKIEVELTRNDGIKARNSFDISFGSLSESASKSLSEQEGIIANITKEIDQFGSFISGNLKSKLKLDETKAVLNELKKKLSNSTSDEDYLSIINSALATGIPESVAKEEEGTNIPIAFGFDGMNVDYISQISEKSLSVDAKEELKKAVSAWINKNYDVKINYIILSKTSDDEERPLLTKFSLDITKKPDADSSADEAYLVINYPKEGIVFTGNYSEEIVGSGTYIPVSGSTKIEFLIYDQIGISSLGMYISPKIEALGVFESAELAEKGKFKWGRFWLWTTILLVIFLIIYISLQLWYKKRYESYLFKNPADLYNVITFIYNSRRNEFSDEEIGKKLKNAGWIGEQITYAFRKLDGKRTGMFEIPLFGLFEKKKIMSEIEKRKASQQVPQTTQTPQAKSLLK